MKLIKGSGGPKTGACWMSAIAHYEGNQAWTDAPDCVCPIIRSVGILANDWMPDDETREREIGPVLFDVVGTAKKTWIIVQFDRAQELPLNNCLWCTIHLPTDSNTVTTGTFFVEGFDVVSLTGNEINFNRFLFWVFSPILNWCPAWNVGNSSFVG